jgi:hypothetical protein
MKDGLLKLGEIIRAVGTMLVGPDLFGAIFFDSPAEACMVQLPKKLGEGAHIWDDRGQDLPEILMTRDKYHSSGYLLDLSATNATSESFRRMVHVNNSFGGMDHGDDSTRASDSDCESQTTSGQASDFSEALQCTTELTVDDARSHVHDTQCHTQSSWKPTLRHTNFVPTVNLTIAPVATAQTTHPIENESCNNGSFESRIEKATCSAVRAAEVNKVWRPKLCNLNTSVVKTPLHDAGSSSATPLDSEEKRAVDHEGEPSIAFVTKQEDFCRCG